MQIFNTLTRQKEEFVPQVPGEYRIYVCGPTVYNFAHIGNARPAVVFDVDSEPETQWCMGGGYTQHDVNVVAVARDLDELDALLPLDGGGPLAPGSHRRHRTGAAGGRSRGLNR